MKRQGKAELLAVVDLDGLTDERIIVAREGTTIQQVVSTSKYKKLRKIPYLVLLPAKQFSICLSKLFAHADSETIANWPPLGFTAHADILKTHLEDTKNV